MAQTSIRSKKGLVLGKFLPPHLGHVYLVDFARNFTSDLHVVVETQPDDPIDGFVRYEWMKSMFAGAGLTIHHLHKVLPQAPEEHDDFWNLWRHELSTLVGEPIDYLFASEDYGHRLADVLDATFIPVDKSRSIRPVSGTAVRDDPFSNWQLLPHCVRGYYAKRICIFGPESTGKSTLTQHLAKHFDTLAVPEYARTYIEELGKETDLSLDCMERIAAGQAAAQASLAPYCNRLLFTDTDPLATVLWTQFLFDERNESIEELAIQNKADLYLLLDVDVPWVADPVRYLPEQRKAFYDACVEILNQHQCNWQPISGSWDARFQRAIELVEQNWF